MKKNNSQPQFKGLNIMNITSPTLTNKKVQGFDTTTKSNFISKVQTLKNKPSKQSIQDQYINGLQDQIHYLQLQLKLLQEKDQAKHGQIDQLQKFFSDGVPINENILAIKNGFNNYKVAGEKKIIELANEKKERETLIEGLKKRIVEMSSELEKQEKNVRTHESNKTEEVHSLIKSQAKLKKQIQLQDEELKQLKLQNRKLNEKLSSLHRNKQIEMVMTLKNQNHKMDKLNKIKESIIEKEAQYQELEKQFQDLLKQEEEKSYVIKIEEQNLNLKKKAISLQRELNALQTKAQEKQLQLDQKLKERHKEISAKTQMKTRVQTEKSKISKQNSMKVEDIQKVAKQKQIALLQKIVNQNKKLAKYTQYYSQLLAKVEDQIQKMVQKKPELKSQINAYFSQVKRLTQSLQQQKCRQSEVYAQIVESQAKTEHFKNILPPLTQKIQKSHQHIKAYTSQKERLIQDIKVKQKQLDLMLILKSLNLQEVQMSKSSSSHIQDRVINFLRNWDQLQRNA